VSRAGSWQSARAGVGLLIAGLVLGIIGLFPNYVGGASLASQADNLVPHIIYLVAWAASALLIGLGGTRQRVGALLGLGASLVTFGLFFADAGTVLANGVHLGGPGLLLSLIGWFACAAGSVVAFGPWPADWPRRLRGREVALALILIVAALGAAITFAPSWDRFTLSTSTGTPQTITAGNAFSNPAPVIVGDVAVMIALFVVVLAAALWRPARLGWALAAGAIVPMVAQAISAFVQVSEGTSPAEFGISPAQATQAGLKISSGLTAVFWVYLVFVIVLIVSCTWLAARRDTALPAATGTAHGYQPATSTPASGRAEQANLESPEPVQPDNPGPAQAPSQAE